MATVIYGDYGVRNGIGSMTAVNLTNQTAVDFVLPSMPDGFKRITVMFNGLSSSGTTHFHVRIGSNSVQTTGYSSCAGGNVNSYAGSVVASASGFLMYNDTAGDTRSGMMTLTHMGSNVWTGQHGAQTSNSRVVNWYGAGVATVSGGPLAIIRLTTENGTDVLDAGAVNVLYE